MFAYVIQTQSRCFPDTNLADTIARCLHLAYERNTSTAIRDLKQQLLQKNLKVADRSIGICVLRICTIAIYGKAPRDDTMDY